MILEDENHLLNLDYVMINMLGNGKSTDYIFSMEKLSIDLSK